MKKVFVLGDGISLGYTQYLAKYLGFEYEVLSKGENENTDCPDGKNFGDSRMLLSYLRGEAMGGRLNYDIIIFNCGLHDIKYNWETEKIQVEPDEYENNLRRICAILKGTGANVYFVNSTPVYDEIHNSTKNIILNVDFVRRPGDIEKYNAIAEKVMPENAVHIIDLYAFTKPFGTKAVRDHVHFFPEIEEKQAQFIANYLK